ncbi:MAG TPA: hypothetical protein VIU46_10790 [Gallionellaceae bacterium]
MNQISNASSLIERRRPRVEDREEEETRRNYWTLYLVIITVTMIAGYFLSALHLYKPGDKIGYNMGLVGGLMMLTLLFYPIRKRIHFMRNWGLLPKWFKWHMIFGILGPALIVFHSTFYIGSINAGVAAACMLLVSGSGIFGRFFYTKIHYGLYGREASLKQLETGLDGVGDVKAIFAFAPKIHEKLTAFRTRSVNSGLEKNLNLWNFLTIGIRVKFLKITLTYRMKRAMYAEARKHRKDKELRERIDEIFWENKEFLDSYLESVQAVSQFSTYERLFSLWHVFHVPLVYMLVFSAIWHVISVHMY